MDDTREEMRKLIDVIEKGSKSASIEQAVEDIKTFANTASYLANALDTRLKQNDAKPKANKRSAKPPMPAIPKPSQGPKPQDSSTGMPNAISTAISQADYDRLKPQVAQAPIGGG